MKADLDALVADVVRTLTLEHVVELPGLGRFHVRNRGPRGRGWGVLFVMDASMRAALARKPSPVPGGAFAPLVTAIRGALLPGGAWSHEELGTLAAVITTPKTFSDPRGRRTTRVGPRRAIAFEPSSSLRERLGHRA